MKHLVFLLTFFCCLPLIAAPFLGQNEILSEIDRYEDGHLLFDASKEGNVDRVLFLLHQGVNADHEMKYGYTAIQIAAENGHWLVVYHLLRLGASPGPSGNYHSGWDRAAKNYRLESLYLFLCSGSYITQRIRDYAYNMRRYNKQDEPGGAMILWVLELFSSEDFEGRKSFFRSKTPDTLPFSNNYDEDYKAHFMRCLLNIMYKSYPGENHLHDMARKKWFYEKDQGLFYNKDSFCIMINQKNAFGETPLHLACILSDESNISFLLNRGASPFIGDFWSSAFICQNRKYISEKNPSPQSIAMARGSRSVIHFYIFALELMVHKDIRWTIIPMIVPFVPLLQLSISK